MCKYLSLKIILTLLMRLISFICISFSVAIAVYVGTNERIENSDRCTSVKHWLIFSIVWNIFISLLFIIRTAYDTYKEFNTDTNNSKCNKLCLLQTNIMVHFLQIINFILFISFFIYYAVMGSCYTFWRVPTFWTIIFSTTTILFHTGRIILCCCLKDGNCRNYSCRCCLKTNNNSNVDNSKVPISSRTQKIESV